MSTALWGWLPLAAVVADHTIVMHGCPPIEDNLLVPDILALTIALGLALALALAPCMSTPNLNRDVHLEPTHLPLTTTLLLTLTLTLPTRRMSPSMRSRPSPVAGARSLPWAVGP